jgi:hypothetical protein
MEGAEQGDVEHGRCQFVVVQPARADRP